MAESRTIPKPDKAFEQAQKVMMDNMELGLLIKDRTEQNRVELPTPDEEQLRKINMIGERWDEWRRWFETNHRERIRENNRRYEATVKSYEDSDDEWRGVNGKPLRQAIEYSTVETYKIRILRAYLSNPEVVKILPRKKSTVDNANKMDKLVRWYLEQDDFIKSLITFLDQGCKNGSCPWLVTQKQVRRDFKEKVRVKRPIKDFIGKFITGFEETVEERDTWEFIENRPSFQVYDIESVGFNWAVGEYKKSPYYIFRQIIHRSVLSKQYPKLAEFFNSGLLDWDGVDDFKTERQQDIGQDNDIGTGRRTQGRIETFFWLEPEGMVVVFGRRMILEIPNPTKATQKEVFTGMLNILPRSFQPYGLDLITLNIPYADLWNELLNNEVDSAKLATNLMWIVKKNSGVEFDSVFTGPGNMVVAENPEDIQQLPFVWTPGQSIGLLEAISQKDQLITGATEAASGVPTNAKFATDIQRMVVESNLKFWSVFTNVKLELKDVVRAIVLHIQEYVAPTISADNPLIFHVTGERGFDQVEINNPQDLDGEYDYRVSFEIEDMDKNLVRAQLIQALEIISGNPALAQFANPQELIKLVFKMFPQVKDLENLVGSPQEQLLKLLNQLDPNQLTQVMGAIQQLIQQKQLEALSTEANKVTGPRGGKLGVTPVPTDESAVSAAANRIGRTGPAVAGLRPGASPGASPGRSMF